MDKSKLKRLDGLRGIAAFGVAWVFHYIHFKPSPNPFQRTALHWFMEDGWILVDLFFVLSGIIMAYRYLDEIRQEVMTADRFFKLRLARLYPIHLFSLLTTFFIQAVSLRLFGKVPIYGNFDSYHFGLNLLMVQKLIFDSGASFNGPSWSVSVEAYLYFIFFWVTRLCPKALGLLFPILASTGLYFTVQNATSATGRGLLGFFFGVIFYRFVLAKIFALPSRRPFDIAAAILVGVLVVGSFAVHGFRSFVGPYYAYSIFLFPLLIYILLSSDILGRVLELRPFLWLGKVSYSVYMMHVTIQMGIFLLSDVFELSIPAEKPWFAMAYGVSILITSWLTYVLIENPARRYLRKTWDLVDVQLI